MIRYKPSIFERINWLPCLSCWSRKPPVPTNEDYMDYTLMEYDLICQDCGANVNHWAHGYMQYPETWTGLIGYWWYIYSQIVIPRAVIKHWGFTHRSAEYIYIRRYGEEDRRPRFNYIEGSVTKR